jgi:hypothetical protein
MADIAFAGGSAVLNIVEGLTKTVARLHRMREAPKQMQDFELKSVTFCDALRMLDEISGQYVRQIGEEAKKHIKHIDGLLRQSQSVLYGTQKLLGKLKGLRKDARAKPWKVWWQKVKWVLNEDPVTRLEAELNLAYSATSCFISMLSFKTKLDRMEDPNCTVEERESLKRQMCVRLTFCNSMGLIIC